MTIDLYQLVLFALAFTAMVATPGPFVAAIAARSAAFGFRTGAVMALGASLADSVYVVMAVLGLAAVAQTHAWALEILRYVGAGWLIWIGVGLLTARTTIIQPEGGTPVSDSMVRAFSVGALLNLGNPKAALFYVSIFPGFFDMSALTVWDAVAILCVTLPVGMASDCGYALAASRMRRMLRDKRSVRRANVASGTVMVTAGAAIAAS